MTFIETSNLAGAALGIRNGNTPWTVERELTVRRLWKAGRSAGEISLELGSTTRNAVIGKLHRFGLTKGDRTEGDRTEGVTLKCSPAARVAGAKVQRRPDGYRRLADKRASEATGGPNAPVRNTTRINAKLAGLDPGLDGYVPMEAPPAAEPIHSLFDLQDEHCRWPHGDPGKPGFHYCGGKAARRASLLFRPRPHRLPEASMSRSGYSDDCERWDLICWRGTVASAIRGQRGQAFLQEMRVALDRLPEPKLITEELEQDGAVCALGAVGKLRGVDMGDLDPDDRETVAARFGIPHTLACEIFYENDEGGYRETPEGRFLRMREWCDRHIRKPPALWFWLDTPHVARKVLS